MNKSNLLILMIVFCCWSVVLTSGHLANAQDDAVVQVTQLSIPMVMITDEKLISFLLNEFFIPETLVTRIDILDVTRNGFGEKDLAKTYPSDNIYFLDIVTERAQTMMDNWKFQANFQIIGVNKDPSVYEKLETNKAANSIFSSLVRTLNRNYHDYPIKLRFERDSSGVTFEMWGYNEDLLQYNPPPTMESYSEKTSDIFHTFTGIKVSGEDTTRYDFLYIYKTCVDTVFINNSSVGTATTKE